jgi:serine/threonine protein kinase
MNSCCECGSELLTAGANRFCGACLLSSALAHSRAAPEPALQQHLTALLSKSASPLGVKFHYVGDYELLEEIGRGGMGVVFRARQTSLNRTVALKMISAGHLASSDAVKRFRTEAVAAARLDHPNIVPVFEVGEHDGLHYFSMKLIRGRRLADRIGAAMAPTDAAMMMMKIARAITHAHSQHVLHRDLKPGNILVDENDEPHVADFGLAKVLGSSESDANTRFGGTPPYLAPEQIYGEAGFTSAADIYSLGVVFYEMLSGRLPFPERCRPLTKRANEVPPGLRRRQSGVDADLEAICFKCLEADTRRRYATANAFADDLENWLCGRPINARRITPLSRTLRWMRRRPAVAALGIISALLVAALPLASHWVREAREEKEQFVSSVREEKIRELRSLRTDWAKLDVPFVSISSELRAEIWKAKAGSAVPSLEPERYTVGIYAHENPVETAGQFAPLLAWLENTISVARSNRVRLDLRIYKDNRAARQALIHGAVDVVRLGAGPLLIAREEMAAKGESIEVLARAAPGRYDATVFARADSGIPRIAQLKGRTLALGDPESTISGFHVPALLAEAGLSAHDLRVEFHRSHMESVNLVLRGKFDAGVAKTPLFESHQDRAPGLVALTNVTCISMPWVARSGLAPGLVTLLRQSLLTLTDTRILDLLPDKPAGFESARADDYDELREHRVSAEQFLGDGKIRFASKSSATTDE